MPFATVSTIEYALGVHGASFDQGLVLMVIVSLFLGVLVFAFAIVCAAVASALSFGLWLTLAVSGPRTRTRRGAVRGDPGRGFGLRAQADHRS